MKNHFIVFRQNRKWISEEAPKAFKVNKKARNCPEKLCLNSCSLKNTYKLLEYLFLIFGAGLWSDAMFLFFSIACVEKLQKVSQR